MIKKCGLGESAHKVNGFFGCKLQVTCKMHWRHEGQWRGQYTPFLTSSN